MRVAYLAALLVLTGGQGHTAGLDGIWVLSLANSDFGLSDPPKGLIVRLKQADTRLVVWWLTTPEGCS